MAMTFDRGWDFDHGNTPITLSKISQDQETIDAITALVEGLDLGGGGTFDGVLGDITDLTVDTAAEYRLILFSNNTVKAIPVATPDPVAPLGLDGSIGLAAVRLTWNAPLVGSVGSYAVYRDGVQIGTNTARNYRDTGVVVSSTYEYKVQVIDPYGQRSPLSTGFSAFIDPALNVAPTVVVTSYPAAAPTNGKTFVRVCASDPNAQTLTHTLECDEGVLVATDDPTCWLYTPAP